MLQIIFKFSVYCRLAVESLQWTQKENSREVRRYKEYKEKAAKRFHQAENKIERLEVQKGKNDIAFQNIKDQFITHTKEQLYLRNITKDVQITLEKLTSNITNVTSQISSVSTKLIAINFNTMKCCSQKTQDKSNFLSPTDKDKQERDNWFKLSGNTTSNDIDIIDFGSGELTDEYLSKVEESSNRVSDVSASKHTEYNKFSLEYESSGEVGSGHAVVGSGDAEELPDFTQGKHYVQQQTFLHEIGIRDEKILLLNKRLGNLSDYVSKLENRITSIQLGNLMQNLQESLINFTQNVITLDQWKISSNQIVNSTLQNQDQIIELTNRIVENSDKISDMRWKVSSNELLSDRQYNILRMYVIRLNNTVEDIKEQMKHFHTKLVPLHQQRYKPDENIQGMETLVSRVEDLALQIVYNQNRLGNLEVKVLNETLYQCRKYNMDTFQDRQLADHEAIIKSNGNSILLVHELVKQIDDSLHEIDGDVKTNIRRFRGLASSFDSFKGIVPVVINMQKEIDNFRFQLPKGNFSFLFLFMKFILSVYPYSTQKGQKLYTILAFLSAIGLEYAHLQIQRHPHSVLLLFSVSNYHSLSVCLSVCLSLPLSLN